MNLQKVMMDDLIKMSEEEHELSDQGEIFDTFAETIREDDDFIVDLMKLADLAIKEKNSKRYKQASAEMIERLSEILINVRSGEI